MKGGQFNKILIVLVLYTIPVFSVEYIHEQTFIEAQRIISSKVVIPSFQALLAHFDEVVKEKLEPLITRAKEAKRIHGADSSAFRLALRELGAELFRVNTDLIESFFQRFNVRLQGFLTANNPGNIGASILSKGYSEYYRRYIFPFFDRERLQELAAFYEAYDNPGLDTFERIQIFNVETLFYDKDRVPFPLVGELVRAYLNFAHGDMEALQRIRKMTSQLIFGFSADFVRFALRHANIKVLSLKGSASVEACYNFMLAANWRLPWDELSSI